MEIKWLKWKEIKKEVEGWEFLYLKNGGRIYYTTTGEIGSGFEFKEVSPVSFQEENGWITEDSECEIGVQGTALFDGIRHLYFGDERTDNFGYIYYPRINDVIECLSKLKGLENKYCRD